MRKNVFYCSRVTCLNNIESHNRFNQTKGPEKVMNSGNGKVRKLFWCNKYSYVSMSFSASVINSVTLESNNNHIESVDILLNCVRYFLNKKKKMNCSLWPGARCNYKLVENRARCNEFNDTLRSYFEGCTFFASESVCLNAALKLWKKNS